MQENMKEGRGSSRGKREGDHSGAREMKRLGWRSKEQSKGEIIKGVRPVS